MPTKKRRVGFIPRNDVLEIINKLSFESNLSNSRIVSILVEEALHKRGIYNIYSDKAPLRFNNIKSPISNNDHPSNLFDSDIYEKFLMFLQFQEKMKKNNL